MKKRTIIAGLVITVIVVTVIIILVRRDSIDNFIASDIVATNIQFSDSVNNETDLGSLYFFTGSNIAHLTTEAILTGSKSDSIFREVPFGTVSKVVFSPKNKVVLARIEPQSESQLADFLPGNSRIPSARQTWVRVDGNSNINLFNPSNFPIIDLYIHGEHIYSLHYRSAEVATLLRTRLDNNRSEVVGGNINGNRIIGVSKNRSVIVRGLDSLTVLKPNQEIENIEVGSKGVFYDTNTDTAGIFDAQSFSLLSLDNLHREDIKVPSGTHIFYAGNGVIVALEGVRFPEKLSYIDLESDKQWVDINIMNEGESLRVAIESVRVLEKDPFILALISSGQDLGVIAPAGKLGNIKPFQLPRFRDTTHGDYSLIYQPGHNTLRIIGDIHNLDLVRRSYSSVQELCSCDINQINKIWLETPSVHAHSEDENYTGDGVPPELQP